MQQANIFSPQFLHEECDSRDVCFRPVETGNQPQLDWVATSQEHYWNCCRRRLGRQSRIGAAHSSNDCDVPPNQISGEFWQAVRLTFSRAILDSNHDLCQLRTHAPQQKGA